MNIPKTVKIGAARYRVKYEKECFADSDTPDKKDLLGQALAGQRVIRLALRDGKVKLPEESLADTFLHEVLHSISRVYGIGLTENQTAGVAGGLMQVIRDNKLDFRR